MTSYFEAIVADRPLSSSRTVSNADDCGFHAAVEDHYEQAVAFAEAGTPCYLIEHPWNKGKPSKENVRWVKGWEELAEDLLSKA